MKEHLTDIALGSPVGTVAGLTIYGIALNDWVYLLTAIYTVILIADKVHSILTRRKAAANKE